MHNSGGGRGGEGGGGVETMRLSSVFRFPCFILFLFFVILANVRKIGEPRRRNLPISF